MRGLHFPSQQDYVEKKTMNSTKRFMGKYFENAPMCFHFLGKKYKKLTLMKARLCERKEQNRIEEPFIVIVDEIVEIYLLLTMTTNTTNQALLGFEPRSSCLQDRHFNQLSIKPAKYNI